MPLMKHFDERDTMFSRLGPVKETRKYRGYYAAHSVLQEKTTGRRTIIHFISGHLRHSPIRSRSGRISVAHGRGDGGLYWRERGYPAYGFTPMILERADIGRVPGIDERISIDNFLLGIKMARDIIRELCT